MATVLVVDDSAVDRRLIGGLLEKGPRYQIEYAADGAEALSRVTQSAPDLIVTDLRMPKIDGLELVRAIRAKHPSVPVILTTAHGSELLAVEALKHGAAGYVPKTHMAEKLLETVEEVLELARADRNYERMINCLSRTDFTFFVELENDLTLIDPLVRLVEQTAARLRLCDCVGQLQIGVALREALRNAILRGNLEISRDMMETAKAAKTNVVDERRKQPPYRDRRVYVDVNISTEQAKFVIRDEGPGFDTTVLPDPMESTSGAGKGGRGLSLMLMFMDEVVFNDTGNEVTLIKHKQRIPKDAR
jgi:CheY-like chemotaxis protein/anti-sigma regulatory factor (Ser/Thr protein kinase)